MSLSQEQNRKKAEAMAESKMHMERNVVGDRVSAREEKFMRGESTAGSDYDRPSERENQAYEDKKRGM